MQAIKKIFTDTLHLLYPHICTGCGSDILSRESQLCARCFVNLPVTEFAKHANNPIEKYFWGRIPVMAAHAHFYFGKGLVVQQLIHQLKYKNNKDIGIFLGELMGKELANSNRFIGIDALIPLPLFPDKERKRGYNQAAIICNGMSTVMNVPVITGNLIRQRYTETQTKKHRVERWENVEGSFAVKDPSLFKNKHLLLVDDVVTTGATLEAAGNVLVHDASVKLSIAAVATASK
jgi:ComF family protein